MARHAVLAVAGILIVALGAANLWAATTVTVFDNYGPGWAHHPDANAYIIGGTWKFKAAMAFVPSQSGHLSDVWLTTGWWTTPVLFDVWLAADGSGLPGATLETWQAQSQGALWNPPQPTPPIHLTSSVAPLVTAGQQYWLCASSDVTTTWDGWYPNPTLQQGTVAYYSINDGQIWQPSTNGLGVMRLDVATPEPATLALLGLGVAGLVVRRRSRK